MESKPVTLPFSGLAHRSGKLGVSIWERHHFWLTYWRNCSGDDPQQKWPVHSEWNPALFSSCWSSE